MANVQSIDEKRQADRRTALLALHADSERVSSDCLTDDQLACLVDHQCTREEQEQFFSHLAGCTTCYRRWLELSELLQADTAQQNGRNLYNFIQPKKLAWAGSLLAAAASVVLFLNITREKAPPVFRQQMETSVDHNRAELPEVQTDEALPVPGSVSVDKKYENKIDGFAPEMEMQGAAPSPAPVKEKIGSSQYSTPQEPAKSVPAQKTERAKRSMAEDMHEEAAMLHPDIVRLQVSDWLARIQQGCQARAENKQFWKEMYQEGRQLIRDNSNEEKKLVMDLLPLIEQLKQTTGNNPFICGEINKKIEKNSGR